MLGRARTMIVAWVAWVAWVAVSGALLAACATSSPAREGRGCPIAPRGASPGGASPSPCDHRGGGPAADAGER